MQLRRERRERFGRRHERAPEKPAGHEDTAMDRRARFRVRETRQDVGMRQDSRTLAAIRLGPLKRSALGELHAVVLRQATVEEKLARLKQLAEVTLALPYGGIEEKIQRGS